MKIGDVVTYRLFNLKDRSSYGPVKQGECLAIDHNHVEGLHNRPYKIDIMWITKNEIISVS